MNFWRLFTMIFYSVDYQILKYLTQLDRIGHYLR